MNRVSPTVEVTRAEFERLIAREFRFLAEGFGFPEPCLWEFAGTFYVSFERDEVQIVTWCGKRDKSVWTSVERLASGRLLGLDTIDSLLDSPFDYPPDTGSHWAPNEFEERLALEAAILRAHLPALLEEDVSIFDEYGSPTAPESVALDDPVETFPRLCRERFRFLESEYGLKYELDGMGGTLLYRGDPVSVRISLLEELYEHESESQPTLSAEIVESPGGHLPPPYLDSDELEISDREGAFTLAYLEWAFDELEQTLRKGLA